VQSLLEQKFPMANFEIEQQKILEASEYAAALDDYRHKTCKIRKAARKDDVEWRKYNGIRVDILQHLTNFRFTLTAFERNPEMEKARLYDITLYEAIYNTQL
jgi:hypothetical protein